MDAPTVERAIAATTELARGANLSVDDAVVVHNSNMLAIRLLPCDVLARVAVVGEEVAAFEIELASQLASTNGPVARLDPRVEPRVYDADGFAVTFWTFYESVTHDGFTPKDYADALRRLHAALRAVTVPTRHFSDRIDDAERLIANRDDTPALADADRELLRRSLEEARTAIDDREAAEQLLHGEPHPGNLLDTQDGLLFIDLETCCRGPIEFDLAHTPESVGSCYHGVDHELLGECRRLVLAMVAAWRWDVRDQFPDGQRERRRLLAVLRHGPPWPTLDAIHP